MVWAELVLAWTALQNIVLPFVGAVLDFLVNKVLGRIYEWVILPIRVFIKRNDRRKFIFQTAINLGSPMTVAEIKRAMGELYRIEHGSDFNEIKANFEIDNIPFRLMATIHPDYDDKKRLKNSDTLLAKTISLEYTCHTLLKETRSNCNLIKGQLEKCEEKMGDANGRNTKYTHSKLIFKMKEGVKFKPVEHFKDVQYIEAKIDEGIIKLTKKECEMSLTTWIISPKTENTLLELLTIMGK